MSKQLQINADRLDNLLKWIANCLNSCGTQMSRLRLIAQEAENFRTAALIHLDDLKSMKHSTSRKTSRRRHAKGSKRSTRKTAKAANGKGKSRRRYKLVPDLEFPKVKYKVHPWPIMKRNRNAI